MSIFAKDAQITQATKKLKATQLLIQAPNRKKIIFLQRKYIFTL